MKRLLCYITILICTSICSCTQMDTSNNRDDADAFIGTYSITIVEDVVWGNDSGTLNDNGTLQIKKISANKVQLISEFIYEQADVVGNNIYIPGDTFSDNAGYYTRSYSNGTLNGNVLSITRYHTGKLASYGILYPYRSTAYITAVKQRE